MGQSSFTVVHMENNPAVTYVAQVVGRRPTKGKVTGSIPGQVTCLGCQYGPWLVKELMRSNQSMFLSFSFSLPCPLSKNK